MENARPVICFNFAQNNIALDRDSDVWFILTLRLVTKDTLQLFRPTQDHNELGLNTFRAQNAGTFSTANFEKNFSALKIAKKLLRYSALVETINLLKLYRMCIARRSITIDERVASSTKLIKCFPCKIRPSFWKFYYFVFPIMFSYSPFSNFMDILSNYDPKQGYIFPTPCSSNLLFQSLLHLQIF